MKFNLETAGIVTRKGSRSTKSTAETYNDPVMKMSKTPGEEESSRTWDWYFNQAALNLLQITPERSDDVKKHVTFIVGDDQEDEALHGRLFVGNFGNDVPLNKNVDSDGYLKTSSRRKGHDYLNEKFDWIDTSEGENLFLLTYFPNDNGVHIAEVTVYSGNTEEERPDVDSQAQEVEETADLW